MKTKTQNPTEPTEDTNLDEGTVTPPETVQTVEAPSGAQPFVEMAQGADGKWHWALWSSQGRIIAINGNDAGFRDQHDAHVAIKSVMEAFAKSPRIAARRR